MQMKDYQKHEKMRCNIIVVAIMMFVLFLLGSFIGGIVSILVTKAAHLDEGKTEIVLSYLTFLGVIILTLLYTRLANKKIWDQFFCGASGNTVKMLLLGLLSGFLMNSICIVPAYLHGDLRFAPGQISIQWFFLSFVMVFIQASAEELLVRGYVFLNLRDRYGFWIALTVSSVLFSLLHIANEGITLLSLANIAIIGIFYAFSVHYLDSIWFAMANHAAWNFTQNFVYGLPNSGLSSKLSLLTLAFSRNSFLYDLRFGIEGTIITTIVVSAGALLIFLYSRNRSKALQKRTNPV